MTTEVIVFGAAILALVASLVIIACGVHAIALERYAEAEKRAFSRERGGEQ